MAEQRSYGPVVPAGTTIDSAGDGVIISVSVHGGWGGALRSETFDVLRHCLAAHPAALLIDLNALQDVEALSLPAWMQVRHVGAAVRPPVLVALCVPPEMTLGHRLQAARTGRQLPVFAKPHQARAALHNLIPADDRLVLHLDAALHAPRLARDLVDRACRMWGLWHQGFSARLIVTELVANAVRHAGTAIRVTVVRRAASLHLIVADDDHRLPRLPQLRRGVRVPSGLHLVAAAAVQWGVIPTTGGKMVWATPRER
ncbi:ATP-binding protein [Nucisporomicrobium flavum]|uniref:ATP-binding protein n=1 Tax=Nucisporomicrobium flavum TaxID=2785915 RepID=UPI003C2F2ED0